MLTDFKTILSRFSSFHKTLAAEIPEETLSLLMALFGVEIRNGLGCKFSIFTPLWSQGVDFKVGGGLLGILWTLFKRLHLSV